MSRSNEAEGEGIRPLRALARPCFRGSTTLVSATPRGKKTSKYEVPFNQPLQAFLGLGRHSCRSGAQRRTTIRSRSQQKRLQTWACESSVGSPVTEHALWQQQVRRARRRRNKSGSRHFLHSMCAPVKRQPWELPRFPRANRWCGMVAVTSCLGAFLGGFDTQTRACPCPALYQACSGWAVCRAGCCLRFISCSPPCRVETSGRSDVQSQSPSRTFSKLLTGAR